MRDFCCMLCKGDKYEVVKDVLRGGYTANKAVRCKICGMQQLFPLPTVEEDKAYYDKNEHDKSITPDFGIEELFNKFKYQNESRVNYLLEYGIDKSWKMLDIACGYGFFISLMRQRGYIFDGLEISCDRKKYCMERNPDAKIYDLNLLEEDPGELEGQYDLITMFHVLEHLTSPVLYLERVKRMLKKNGLLVIELPNVSNLMMEASPAFNDFFYFRDHVAYYSPQHLATVLEKSGFEIITVKGNQLYGLTNHYNWIVNGTPEREAPSYETCDPLKWLEKMYKDTLDIQIRSEYMYAIAVNK